MELLAIYREIVNYDLWDSLFQYVHKISLRNSFDLTSVAAYNLDNEKRNRYTDVLPFDVNRVILKSKPQKSDYINASYVEIYWADQEYILTQGPLKNTLSHFWDMIFENDSKCIIMLCNEFEGGRCKCQRYWPLDNEKLFIDEFTIELIKTREQKNYSTRNLEVRKGKKSKVVVQFHFTAWPDFGVPESSKDFLKFVYFVRSSQFMNNDKYGPPIVHCSAGIGRSGTYIIVDGIFKSLLEFPEKTNFDIIDILLSIRQMRKGLIQTSEQLKFTYVAIISLIRSKFLYIYEEMKEYCTKHTNKYNSYDKDIIKNNSLIFISIKDDMERIKKGELDPSKISVTRQAIQIVNRIKSAPIARIRKSHPNMLVQSENFTKDTEKPFLSPQAVRLYDNQNLLTSDLKSMSFQNFNKLSPNIEYTKFIPISSDDKEYNYKHTKNRKFSLDLSSTDSLKGMNKIKRSPINNEEDLPYTKLKVNQLNNSSRDSCEDKIRSVDNLDRNNIDSNLITRNGSLAVPNNIEFHKVSDRFRDSHNAHKYSNKYDKIYNPMNLMKVCDSEIGNVHFQYSFDSILYEDIPKKMRIIRKKDKPLSNDENE